MATIAMAVQHIQQRLYRSHKDKIISGICGGLSDYFNVDSFIFRAVFVVLTFVNGTGLLLYIILWIIVPWEGEKNLSKNGNIAHIHGSARSNLESVYSNISTNALNVFKKRNAGKIIAVTTAILIGTGVLLSNLFSVSLLRFEIIWPLFLIFIGLYLIFYKNNNRSKYILLNLTL